MSSSEPVDHRSVLHLQQIEIETASRRSIRITLQVDGRHCEIRRVEQALTWSPTYSLELVEASTIRVIIKTGHTVAGLSIRKLEALAEVSVQEAMEAFWHSETSISHQITFDGRPATVTFKLRPSPTGETTRAAVEELEKEMKTYRVLMNDSTEHKIDMVFKSGAVLAELNPIVKVAFGVAKGAFEVLKEQKKRDEAVSDLADGVGRILPFAELVIEDIICEETELLERVVGRLCVLIRDTASFICEYAKQSLTRRVIKSNISLDASSKIKQLQGDLAKLEKDFDRAVDVTTLKMAKKNDTFRLLDRLKPTDAASYQESRSCMAGTRTALLDHLIDWASKPESPNNLSNSSGAANMYWLYGSPGLGKTSIANSLCNRLHESKNLGGSFFCRRDDAILREPKRVLPTLVSRLAWMWGPYRKLVSQALENDPQLNPESRRCETLFLLLESVQSHPSGTLVLIVDALDECGDSTTRSQLLECLLKACSRVPWIKVVITSRPEHDIKTFFEKNQVTSRNLAKDERTHHDIRLFTRYRMASLAEQFDLPSNWPGESRLEQIIDRSGGLFIFVETLYQFLHDPDPEPLLTQVLGGTLGGANTELHKLYSTAIETRIGHNKEHFHMFVQALVAVATRRSLPDTTLASLIGLQPRVVSSWVNALSSLLYRDASENGGIRVRHLSIIEFLTGPTCPPEFRVDLQEANRQLGHRCIITMMKELKFNICKLETSCVFNADIPALDNRMREKISDALQYSCMHWSSHLCSGSSPASENECEILGTFLTGAQLLYWLEVLSLMGKVLVAITALRQMKAHFKKFAEGLQRPVEDALRFVMAFFAPISASAPHIYISSLSFMPVGSPLWKWASLSFSGLMDVCEGRMKSWPAPSGIWPGHTSPVCNVAYSPDGWNVVSSSLDCTIRIWDVQTGAAVGDPLKGHTGPVYSVAYSPDGQNIVSGSSDNTIRIWDAQAGVTIGDPLTGHQDSVKSIAYSPDGQTIVSGSLDDTIRIWDVHTGATVGHPLRGHEDAVNSIAYSPNGRNIVSGSKDNTIRIWDVQKGAAVGEPLKGHTGPVLSVAYSPDGQNIVSGSFDGTIRIWDAQSGEAIGDPLRGHQDSVKSVSYSPDGTKIISGSKDDTIRIWDVQTGATVSKLLKGHHDAVNSVAYSPDGRNIISCSADRMIRIWDVETGEAVAMPEKEHTASVWSVAYSPDGKNVVSGSWDNTVRIWDAQTGAAVGEPLEGHTGPVYAVAYSPDSQNIISGSEDKTIRIWDAETGAAVVEPLEGHQNAIYSVAYSPDGRRIISGSWDYTIRTWDAHTGEAVGGALKGHTKWVSSVAYSPDGQNVVSGSCDNTVRIWDVQTGSAVGGPLKGHNLPVCSIAYSPDSRNIISGSDDTTIRIWDAKTGAAVGEPLKGHIQAVTSVACSPDGRHAVSGSWDHTIRTWDIHTGAVVGDPLEVPSGSVRSVAYSPDGRSVVSGSDDGTVRIWDAQVGAAIGEPPTWDTPPAFSSISHGAFFDSSKPSSDYVPLNTFTGLPIPTTMLNSDGWVCGAEGLLFWVPEDCRDGLTCPAKITIPTSGRHRPVRIDFTRFRYGTSWTEVLEGNEGDDLQSQVLAITC